jgi:CRISPR-associated exonuclease Cas4
VSQRVPLTGYQLVELLTMNDLPSDHFLPMTITPSHLLEYLYCPRFTYFEYVLGIPQHQEKYYKVVKGREVHAQKARQHVAYLRQRLGVVDKQLDVYLTGARLRGEVDEVLWLADGTMAPLDYKFAKWEERLYQGYQTQIACYALLIEANYGKPVERGYLVYTRSGNKLVEVPVTQADKDRIRTDIDAVLKIIGQNHFPRATKSKRKCLSCTYRNLCIQ